MRRSAARPVVVFGTNSATATAALMLEEGDLEPVAFTVDRRFVDADEHAGLPLVAFEDLAARFPPSRVDLIAPVGARGMGAFRAQVCARARERGYALASWASRRANVWSGIELGPNTIVLPGATVMPYARLGEDVSVRANAVVAHHATVGDHAMLANGAITGGHCTIGAGAWLGLGSVVRDGVTVAPRTLVGAGAVVAADTEEDGVYVGVPARRLPGVSATARSED